MDKYLNEIKESNTENYISILKRSMGDTELRPSERVILYKLTHLSKNTIRLFVDKLIESGDTIERFSKKFFSEQNEDAIYLDAVPLPHRFEISKSDDDPSRRCHYTKISFECWKRNRLVFYKFIFNRCPWTKGCVSISVKVLSNKFPYELHLKNLKEENGFYRPSNKFYTLMATAKRKSFNREKELSIKDGRHSCLVLVRMNHFNKETSLMSALDLEKEKKFMNSLKYTRKKILEDEIDRPPDKDDRLVCSNLLGCYFPMGGLSMNIVDSYAKACPTKNILFNKIAEFISILSSNSEIRNTIHKINASNLPNMDLESLVETGKETQYLKTKKDMLNELHSNFIIHWNLQRFKRNERPLVQRQARVFSMGDKIYADDIRYRENGVDYSLKIDDILNGYTVNPYTQIPLEKSFVDWVLRLYTLPVDTNRSVDYIENGSLYRIDIDYILNDGKVNPSTSKELDADFIDKVKSIFMHNEGKDVVIYIEKDIEYPLHLENILSGGVLRNPYTGNYLKKEYLMILKELFSERAFLDTEANVEYMEDNIPFMIKVSDIIDGYPNPYTSNKISDEFVTMIKELYARETRPQKKNILLEDIVALLEKMNVCDDCLTPLPTDFSMTIDDNGQQKPYCYTCLK